MSRTSKNKSIVRTKKSSCLNDLSIIDAENFEPPQISSTPSKTIKRNSKRILRDNNSLNISVINKHEYSKNENVKIDNQIYKPILPVVEETYKYDRAPELFYSDPEEESSMSENTIAIMTNDSDDKWTTLSDVSEDRCGTNVSDLLAEIDAEIGVRFEKPPRKSYPGSKRKSQKLYENEDEKEETKVKITKKDKKLKPKKKIDPQEEAFIQSINEHFNDVETFNLAVE